VGETDGLLLGLLVGEKVFEGLKVEVDDIVEVGVSDPIRV